MVLDPIKLAARTKRFREKNREQLNAYMRNSYKNDPEKFLARQKAHAKKIALDPVKKKKRQLYNKEYSAKYREKNKEVIRARSRGWQLKAKYGITVEAFETMAEAQDYKCANPACRTDNPGPSGQWNIDHCHKTDAVRGLLCWRCNLTLGHVNDDEALLSGLIEYLRKHKNV